MDEDSAKPEKPNKSARYLEKHKHHWLRFRTWYVANKKQSVSASILIIIVILGAVPFTRYSLAGLVLKKDFIVQVSDTTAHKSVSGATVSIGSISATTDGNGKAVLHDVKVGNKTLLVSKKYYQNQSSKVLVGILKEKTIPAIVLTATGRQVKVTVTNAISGKAISGVNLAVADIKVKTDNSGNALLVLPAGKATQTGKLSLEGYNDVSVSIQISNTSIKENDFKITPTGKIYFISKLTGQLNVMKANLDGSDPVVAVAATGNEEDSNTALLQSPDGKYVALVAKRSPDDSTAQLYVLSTADDKLVQADSGIADFNMYGWANDTLIYTVRRQDISVWQPGVGKVKAYNAAAGNIKLLDQIAGSDAYAAISEYYNNVVISGNQVIYSKDWTGAQYSYQLNGKQDTVQVIDVDGQNHKTVGSYDAATTSIVQLIPHSPNSFYIFVSQNSADPQYFDYTVGGNPKAVDLSTDQVYKTDYTYFFSPSGNQTFWNETRDGKSTLLVGDDSGASPTTVATLSDYTAYGWYTDQYLILSKGGSELYIMSAKGGPAVKISNYQNTGYGYGYQR